MLPSNVISAPVTVEESVVEAHPHVETQLVVAPLTVNVGQVRAPIMTQDQVMQALLSIGGGDPAAPVGSLLAEDVTALVDGSQTNFSHPSITAAVMIFINGQLEPAAFSGAVATLADPPQPGDIVLIFGTA
ncbi:MAG: hypothetical protein AAF226_08675 [Verrucomicrobiota bacterium]